MTQNMLITGTKLDLLIDAYMEEHHPGVEYSLDWFDSDNGDEDWEEPFAATLEVPSLGVEDAYGLCDAGVSTPEEQAKYLLEQIVEELTAALRR